jgi:hypothetical protein
MKDAQIISESSSDELDLIVVVERMVAFIKRFFYILIIFPTVGIIAAFVLFYRLKESTHPSSYCILLF